MTTISDTFYGPSGAPIGGVAVRASLVAAAETLAAGGAIIREAETVSATDGTWSLTLTPLSELLVPGGAYYLVGADGHRWTIDVPDSGTYTLADVMVEPDPMPGLALTAATGVTLATVTAEGDLIVGSGPGAVTRLAVGTDGQVLTADPSAPDGLAWADASGGGGSGLPSGGTTGQLLRKASGTDGDAGWHTTTAADVGADAAGSATAAVGALAGTLGNSSTRDVGTTSGTVAAGNDTRIVGAAQSASLGGAATKNVGTTAGTVAAGDDSRFKAVGTTAGTVAAGDDTRITGAAQSASLGNSSTRNVGTTSGTVAAGDDSRFKAVGTTSGTVAAGDDTRITGAAAASSLGNSSTRNVGTTTGTVAAGDDSRIVGAAAASSLGGAATKNVGTTAGTVAAGDDSRIVGAAAASSLGTAATKNVGTTAGTVAAGDDSRFKAVGTTSGTVAAGDDSRITGAMQLDPPNVSGAYVGNVALAPDVSPNTNPWLTLQQPYSSGDTNPDAIQLFSTHSDGTTKIKTSWFNGNNEGRDSPSTASRIARRVFEFAVSLGGGSTGRYFELSTNPVLASDREPLLGAYGTASSTKPGWIEATRVMSGLSGVAVGGSYPSGAALGQLILRGYKSSTGAPTSGAYVANDVVIDSAGQLWLCTVSGTPGTWTGGPTSFGSWTALASLGTNVSVPGGTASMQSRTEPGGMGRVAGQIIAGAVISTGTVLCTLAVGTRPLNTEYVLIRVRGSGSSALITINTDGTITSSLTFTNASSDTINLGYGYRIS